MGVGLSALIGSFYLQQGGCIFTHVSLLSCLFICQQDYTESTEPTCTKHVGLLGSGGGVCSIDCHSSFQMLQVCDISHFQLSPPRFKPVRIAQTKTQIQKCFPWK